MTRESRILLVIGLLAVLGVTSLLMIADRYRRLLAAEPRPQRASQGEASPELRAAAAAEAVERFLVVREVVVRAIGSNREPLATTTDPRTGELRGDASDEVRAAYGRTRAEIHRLKAVELGRLGMTEHEYDRLRLAFLDWLDGTEGLDEALRGAFEPQRTRLEDLRLGALEILDEPRPD
jgi:hypothetical protein